jgi:Flp pilus assembly protein TadD
LLAYYSTGNYEKAIADANSILRINPRDADILNQRGLSYGNLGKSQEAIADFNSAISINPGKGYYYQNRSYELAKTGELKGALADILKARELGIKVNPNYVQALQERVIPGNN